MREPIHIDDDPVNEDWIRWKPPKPPPDGPHEEPEPLRFGSFLFQAPIRI